MKRAWVSLVLGLSLAVNAGVAVAVVRERVRIRRIDDRLARDLREGRAGLKQYFKFFDDYVAAGKPMSAAIDTAYLDLGRLGLEPSPDSVAVEKVLDRLRAQWRLRRLLQIKLSREHWALYRPEVAERIKARIRAMEKEGRRLADDDSMPAGKAGR